MIGTLILVAFLAVLVYFLFKGLINIVKFLLFFMLLFILMQFFFKDFFVDVSRVFNLPSITGMIGASTNYITSKFFNLQIISQNFYEDRLVILVRNTGWLPLTSFEVYLDDEKVKILERPLVLLPQRTGVIEVEYKDFYKIKIVSNNVEIEYTR
ncbi:MAG: hypothetical protein N3D78_02145 [Candidatus Aenigmarchaeota archaeon]|nr:hypothetical protein [Candidatus Aenigmarchaeota archaeon]